MTRRLKCGECGAEVEIAVLVSAAWCARCGVELVEVEGPKVSVPGDICNGKV